MCLPDAEPCTDCPAWSGERATRCSARQHGVVHRAHPHLDQVARYLIDGDALLRGSLGGARDQIGHLLHAAHHRDASVFDHGNDVAAVLADVKFLFHFEVPPIR